jgi:Uma2 family endonuclease
MDGDLIGVRPHRFTVDDYYRIVEAGLLPKGSRVELIRGQIVDRHAIGSPHLGMVIRLTRLMVLALAGRGLVSVQNSVRLDMESEPEPDVVVLAPRDDDYDQPPHPGPSDVMLLIEVADSSLEYDRTPKAELYAESGIGEYWIVNLTERVVEVLSRPVGGLYQDRRRVAAGQTLDIVALPGVSFMVSVLFPRQRDVS